MRCDRLLTQSSICSFYLVEYEKWLVGTYIIIKIDRGLQNRLFTQCYCLLYQLFCFAFLLLGFHRDVGNYCQFVVEITHIFKQQVNEMQKHVTCMPEVQWREKRINQPNKSMLWLELIVHSLLVNCVNEINVIQMCSHCYPKQLRPCSIIFLFFCMT